MGTYKRTEGQTLIETAIILFLLLLILLGITEFSRAWYTKNSLKNAVRHGARIAVVTDGIDPTPRALNQSPCPSTGYTNCAENTCPSNPTDNDDIRDAVCCSPGVQNRAINNNPNGPRGTEVIITYTDDDTSVSLSNGDTVSVCARTQFQSVVGSSFWPWLQNILITTDASMRYEK